MMTASIAHITPQPDADGGCELLTRTGRSERCRDLGEQGFVVARVAPSPNASDRLPNAHGHGAMPLTRGQLGEAIEGAVEISLALRGALPPTETAKAVPAAAAREQLRRVRALGAKGLCLVLPELRRLANDDATLDLADSEALTAWRRVSEEEPVVILLDHGDRDVSILAPVPLTAVFGHPADDEDDEPVSWADDERALHAEVEDHQSGAACDSVPSLEELSHACRREEQPTEEHQRWHHAPFERAAGEGRTARSVLRCDPLEGVELGGASGGNAPAAPLQGSLFDAPPHPFCATPPPRPKPVMAQERCRQLCAELGAASGPKPARTIEDLFRTRYTPLLEALGKGLRDEEAAAVVHGWRSAFERSYAEGYAAMRVTGKRPTMVLDAPDLAARAGRAHGARSVQLVMVDAMRFDLGERVADALTEALSGRAACVDRTLLWVALPSTTPLQLHLLARGPRGLAEPDPASERDAVVQRGKSVTALRRIRIGKRDLLKLDVVEARLRDAGPGFEERTAALVDEVTRVLVELAESLPPRTLLYLFGDHGFRLPSEDSAHTGRASQGGASPEEILVGAFAWMVGGVH